MTEAYEVRNFRDVCPDRHDRLRVCLYWVPGGSGIAIFGFPKEVADIILAFLPYWKYDTPLNDGQSLPAGINYCPGLGFGLDMECQTGFQMSRYAGEERPVVRWRYRRCRRHVKKPCTGEDRVL